MAYCSANSLPCEGQNVPGNEETVTGNSFARKGSTGNGDRHSPDIFINSL
ncbi:hypothetical protein [Phormidium sp. CCY1219]|nr:hypothetical protein [Phormidium sp. CCY1219]MEB3828850.1 hypothetical protein [Phormidium sp. CCY1219]